MAQQNTSMMTYKPDAVLMPNQSEWSLMLDMAAQLVPTGFLPTTIRTPQQAVAIMLKGRELGVPPMYALSNIVIVNGKPSISAEMMLALVYRDHGKKATRIKHSDDTQCTMEYRLEGWPDVSSYTFSIDQAKKAGLLSNQTWTKYPAAMLRARCISAVARMAFPESIAGMYSPGELGEDVTVTDDGVVLSIAPATVDRTTGEVTDTPAIPSGMDQQRVWNTANAALQAWADEIGITRDDIHNAAVALSKGKHASIGDMSAAQLDGLKSRLQDAYNRDNVKFAQWLDSIDPKAPQAPTQPEQPLTPEEAIEMSLDSGQLPGMDDAELERNTDRIAEAARS